jgi:hypothetical protein
MLGDALTRGGTNQICGMFLWTVKFLNRKNYFCEVASCFDVKLVYLQKCGSGLQVYTIDFLKDQCTHNDIRVTI